MIEVASLVLVLGGETIGDSLDRRARESRAKVGAHITGRIPNRDLRPEDPGREVKGFGPGSPICPAL